MAEKNAKIYFVVWPDGKMFERTQNSISESHAIAAAIRTWLIPDFFPELDLGSKGYGVMATLWRSMEKAGFKCHCVEVPGTSGVSY